MHRVLLYLLAAVVLTGLIDPLKLFVGCSDVRQPSSGKIFDTQHGSIIQN